MPLIFFNMSLQKLLMRTLFCLEPHKSMGNQRLTLNNLQTFYDKKQLLLQGLRLQRSFATGNEVNILP